MAETVCYQQGMHLGRTFDLKQMQPGLDIFSEETLTKSKTTDNHQTSITYSVIENNKDVKDVLGVDGAFALKVKAGLCKVQGKGDYLKTQRSKNNTVEILARAHVETMTETLTDTKALPGWRDNLIGTHYIRSITYGGDMIASIRIEGNNESVSKEIKAKVDAGLTFTGVIDVEAKGKFKQLEEDLKSVSRITISYFSTSLQGAMPRDINGMLVALDGFKDQVLKSNNGRGVPLTCELLPLNVLDSSIPQTLKNKTLDVQLTKLDDYYEDILQAKSVLERALEEDDLELDSAQETEVLNLEESIDDMMAVFNNVIANLDITTSKGESYGSSQIAPAFEVYRKYKKQPGSYQRKVTRFLESLQPQKSSVDSIPTKFDEENNFAGLMQPYDNIEDLISPAPLFIALLGQLILMSLETDLSLITEDDSPPMYLTHPNSLRTSLLQVCHSGWDALNLAHKNMDAIRTKNVNVPTHINDSVKIIVAGTTEEMEVILPKALKNIKITADCTKKAQDVERKFVDVMHVISELLKLCTAKCQAHEKEIQENKAALQAAEASRVQVEKEQAEVEENLWEEKDYLRQTRDEYDKVLDEMPTTATLMRPGPNVISHMKYEKMSLVMRQSMENYNAAQKRTQEVNREMAALVAQISRYYLKELDFETIRNTLLQGIHVMGKVMEQCSKLLQYYQMMANILEHNWQESLHGFLKSAESSHELKMKNGGQYNLPKVMRDVIYLQASKANQIAHLVQGLSGTYVEVSDRYILRPLAGLDKLITVDADKDKTRIKEIQRELQQGAEDAAEAIKELVQERHDEIMEKGYERINKYEKTMREALPPPTPAEVKQIEKLKEAAAKPLSEPSVDIGGW